MKIDNIRDEARERRRKRRKRVVLFEKILIAVLVVGLLTGGGILIYNLMPEIKLAKQLEAAGEFIEMHDYDDAIASCEEALAIDSSSVQAYTAMAGAYLDQEDISSAKQILYQGWETTHDESLLQYYCTVMLNEAVADINAQKCTLKTLDKCISVLEKDADNADFCDAGNTAVGSCIYICFVKMDLFADKQACEPLFGGRRL